MDLPLFDTDVNDAPPVETPGGFSPFPFQTAADDAIWRATRDADRTNVAIATGCGKTEIACIGLQRDWGKPRKLFIVNRQEIVQQTAERLKSRGIDCEIEMGQMRSDAEVTVASYQSLIKKRGGIRRIEKYLGHTGVAYIDEYHSYYSELLLSCLNDLVAHGCKIVAMTASPPNLKKNKDSGQYELLSEHFGRPAYTYSYPQALEDGYLCEVRQHLVVMRDFDLSRVRDSFGDYNQTALAKLLKQRHMIAGVGQMIEDYWEGKPSVVFASDIDHAEYICGDLAGRGIEASIIHSDTERMDSEERRMHLHDFMTGRSKIIVNVGILTMGWDFPPVCKGFVARCTKSLPLYLQMFGRLTRTVIGNQLSRLHTVEERKAAIDASTKPFAEIFDITDSTRNCSIKTALDVLYPTLDDRLMVQARERAAADGGQPVAAIDRVIQKEAAALRAMEEAAMRRALKSRLGIEVDGEVTAYHRELLADAEQQDKAKGKKDYWWMPYGKHKGKSFKTIHAQSPGYLPYLLQKRMVSDPGLRANMITFLKKRRDDASNWVRSQIDMALAEYTS